MDLFFGLNHVIVRFFLLKDPGKQLMYNLIMSHELIRDGSSNK